MLQTLETMVVTHSIAFPIMCNACHVLAHADCAIA